MELNTVFQILCQVCIKSNNLQEQLIIFYPKIILMNSTKKKKSCNNKHNQFTLNKNKGFDMCFCAEASFGAAGALAITGLLSCKLATKKSQSMIAAIPLIFALQQMAEGILWLTAGMNNLVWLHTIAAYLFLLCAFVIWPTWIPVSLYIYEQHKKFILKLLIALGGIVSVGLMVLMIVRYPAITTHNHHVQYVFALPDSAAIIGTIAYAMITIVPFFASHNVLLKIMGALIMLSAGITWFMWYEYFVSVWCFFAALLSMFIILVIAREKRIERI